MKTKIFLLATLLAAGGMVSCDNRGENNVTGGEHTLVIKLPAEMMRGPETRAVENQEQTGKTPVDDLTVFLMAGQAVQEASSHPWSEFSNGYLRYEQVPGNVNNVIVVANAVGETIKNLDNAQAIRKYAFTVNSQHQKSGLSGRTMIGEAEPKVPQAGDPKPDGHDYKLAEVTLNSLTSRIEVGTVKAGTGIKEVELLGVWINNYYPTYAKAEVKCNNQNDPVWGVTNSNTLQKPGVPTDQPIGAITIDTSVYTEADYVDMGSSEVKLADDSKVYAYHTFSGNVPHLILLVKGEYESGYYETKDGKELKYFYGWVTYTKFRDATLGTYANPFEANKIYKMGVGSKGIVINQKDIYPEPEMNPFDLGLDIKIADWMPVEVTPEI